MAYLVESLTTGELSVAKPTFSPSKIKLFNELVVTVPSFRTVEDHTEYEIQTCLPHGVIGLGCIHTVWKRFKEFKQFHSMLWSLFAGTPDLPALPVSGVLSIPKRISSKVFGVGKAQLIESRWQQLGEYLNSVVKFVVKERHIAGFRLVEEFLELQPLEANAPITLKHAEGALLTHPQSAAESVVAFVPETVAEIDQLRAELHRAQSANAALLEKSSASSVTIAIQELRLQLQESEARRADTEKSLRQMTSHAAETELLMAQEEEKLRQEIVELKEQHNVKLQNVMETSKQQISEIQDQAATREKELNNEVAMQTQLLADLREKSTTETSNYEREIGRLNNAVAELTSSKRKLSSLAAARKKSLDDAEQRALQWKTRCKEEEDQKLRASQTLLESTTKLQAAESQITELQKTLHERELLFKVQLAQLHANAASLEEEVAFLRENGSNAVQQISPVQRQGSRTPSSPRFTLQLSNDGDGEVSARDEAATKPSPSEHEARSTMASKVTSEQDRPRSEDSDRARAEVATDVGTESLPTQPSSSQDQVLSDQANVCRNWAQTGRCRFGSKCRFRHPNANENGDATHLLSLPGYHKHPLGPDTKKSRKKFFCDICGQKARDRFRCAEGCDFDVCLQCVTRAESSKKDVEAASDTVVIPAIDNVKQSQRDGNAPPLADVSRIQTVPATSSQHEDRPVEPKHQSESSKDTRAATDVTVSTAATTDAESPTIQEDATGAENANHAETVEDAKHTQAAEFSETVASSDAADPADVAEAAQATEAAEAAQATRAAQADQAAQAAEAAQAAQAAQAAETAKAAEAAKAAQAAEAARKAEAVRKAKLAQQKKVADAARQAQLAQEQKAAKQRRQTGFRGQLIAFYLRHNPDKVADVDSLLARYRGREEEMMAVLKRKYGVQ